MLNTYELGLVSTLNHHLSMAKTVLAQLKMSVDERQFAMPQLEKFENQRNSFYNMFGIEHDSLMNLVQMAEASIGKMKERSLEAESSGFE